MKVERYNAPFREPLGLGTGGKVSGDIVALKMRLKMFGRCHRSFFRLGVMDSREPRDGRVVEELGWYDPCAQKSEEQVSLNRERIEHWLGYGAQPTDTVRDLLKRNGIPVGKKK